MNWTKAGLAAACACALAAHGMPSQRELEKAQGLVAEVIRSDVAAFNAGKKKPAEVADAALRYADEAQGEAARFLLLKGAFYYRMRAADYDGAMAVISRMRRDIADLPDKTLVEILSGTLRRVPRKHCGQLYDLLQHTQNRIRYTQEVKELAAKAKANPSDKALRTALGEMHALLGDWKAALPELAAGTGPAAEAAALEQKAKTGEAADAWWALAGTDGSDRSLAYRAHAARLYRAAVRDGSLPGLKKTLAEKRIAEAKADGFPEEPKVSPSAVASGERPKSMLFDLGGGQKLRVQGCPAGTFTMGYAGGEPFYTPHKVTISRPFWVGKFLVTREQWDQFMPPRLLNECEIALGGPRGAVSKVSRKEVDEYCGKLTERFRSQLPKGYVFRLPTLAEAEYFWRANSTDGNDPYAKPRGLSRQELSMIAVGHAGKQEILRQKGVSWDESVWRIPALNPTVQVGLRKPNAWDLHDLSGNADTWLLDTFPSDKTADARHGVKLANDLAWQDAVDPLFWSADGLDGSGLFRGTRLAKAWGEVDILYVKPGLKFGSLGFRLVVGPDLLKERANGGTPAASPAAEPPRGGDAPSASAAVAPPRRSGAPAASATPAPVTKPQTAERPKPLTFKLNARQGLELQGIPAGTFEMGYKDWNRNMFASKLNAPRRVTISRPFWMSTTPVTVGQLSALRVAEEAIRRFRNGRPAKDLTDAEVDRLAGPAFGETSAEEFLKALNRRFKNRPKGYVFRLPTSAEWEYALKADGSDPIFLRMELGRLQDDYITKAAHDCMDKAGWPAEPFKRRFLTRYVPPALLKPNPWGLCGIAMPTGHLVLDTADMRNVTLKPNRVGEVDLVIDALKGAPLPDTDPVHVDDSKRAVHLVRGWSSSPSAVTMPRSGGVPHCFNVVLGPELGK